MWFEILPSFGIIVVLLSVPHVSGYVINKLGNGNMYRRSFINLEQRLQYARDIRIGEDPYKIVGLDNISDE